MDTRGIVFSIAERPGRIIAVSAALIGVLGLLGVLTASAGARPGQLDPSFGTNGLVQVGTGTDAGQVARDSARTPDGRLIVAGRTDQAKTGLVAAYRADGSIDSGFGSGGSVEGISTEWDQVIVEPGGKVVLAGKLDESIVVARLAPDGTLDSAFGTDGVFSFAPDATSDPELFGHEIDLDVLALKVIDGGRIRMLIRSFACPGATVNGGSSAGCRNTSLLALTEAGNAESEIGGGDGYLSLDLDSIKTGGVILADGRIDVVGTTAFYRPDVPYPLTRMFSRRFTAAGTADTSYTGGSIVGGGDFNFDEIAVESDPAGGTVSAFGGSLVRFESDGLPRSSFGDHGVLVPRLTDFTFRNSSFEITDSLFDERGRIVITGGFTKGAGRFVSATDGFVARLLPNGYPDRSFGGGGIEITWRGLPPGSRSDPSMPAPFPPTDWHNANRIYQRSDGAFLVAGTGAHGGTDLRLTIASVQGGEFTLPRCGNQEVDFVGTEGPDRIHPLRGRIATLGGDDVIVSNGSRVCSGSGNDRIESVHGTELHGGPGNDEIFARGRTDLIRGGYGDDLIKAGGYTESISAGPGDDAVHGSPGNDRILGGAGDDVLRGWNRDDLLIGGSGRDLLLGGGGLDQLFGGPGRDRLDPGPSGPMVDLYVGYGGAASLKIVRIGGHVKVSGNVAVTCKPGADRNERIGLEFDLKRADGRFAHSPDPADPVKMESSVLTGIAGRFKDRVTTGRVRLWMDWNAGLEDYGPSDEPVCWTGRSPAKPWVNFRSKLRPKPKQFAKQ